MNGATVVKSKSQTVKPSEKENIKASLVRITEESSEAETGYKSTEFSDIPMTDESDSIPKEDKESSIQVDLMRSTHTQDDTKNVNEPTKESRRSSIKSFSITPGRRSSAYSEDVHQETETGLTGNQKKGSRRSSSASNLMNNENRRNSEKSMPNTPTRRRSSAFSNVLEQENLITQEPKRERRRGSIKSKSRSSSTDNISGVSEAPKNDDFDTKQNQDKIRRNSLHAVSRGQGSRRSSEISERPKGESITEDSLSVGNWRGLGRSLPEITSIEGKTKVLDNKKSQDKPEMTRNKENIEEQMNKDSRRSSLKYLPKTPDRRRSSVLSSFFNAFRATDESEVQGDRKPVDHMTFKDDEKNDLVTTNTRSIEMHDKKENADSIDKDDGNQDHSANELDVKRTTENEIDKSTGVEIIEDKEKSTTSRRGSQVPENESNFSEQNQPSKRKKSQASHSRTPARRRSSAFTEGERGERHIEQSIPEGSRRGSRISLPETSGIGSKADIVNEDIIDEKSQENEEDTKEQMNKDSRRSSLKCLPKTPARRRSSVLSSFANAFRATDESEQQDNKPDMTYKDDENNDMVTTDARSTETNDTEDYVDAIDQGDANQDPLVNQSLPETSSIGKKTDIVNEEITEPSKQENSKITENETDIDEQSNKASRRSSQISLQKTPTRRRSSVLSSFINVFKGTDNSEEVQESSTHLDMPEIEKERSRPERKSLSRSPPRDRVSTFSEVTTHDILDSEQNLESNRRSSGTSPSRTPTRRRSSTILESQINENKIKGSVSRGSRKGSRKSLIETAAIDNKTEIVTEDVTELKAQNDSEMVKDENWIEEQLNKDSNRNSQISVSKTPIRRRSSALSSFINVFKSEKSDEGQEVKKSLEIEEEIQTNDRQINDPESEEQQDLIDKEEFKQYSFLNETRTSTEIETNIVNEEEIDDSSSNGKRRSTSSESQTDEKDVKVSGVLQSETLDIDNMKEAVIEDTKKQKTQDNLELKHDIEGEYKKDDRRNSQISLPKTPARRRSSVLSAFINVFRGTEESSEVQKNYEKAVTPAQEIANEQMDSEFSVKKDLQMSDSMDKEVFDERIPEADSLKSNLRKEFEAEDNMNNEIAEITKDEIELSLDSRRGSKSSIASKRRSSAFSEVPEEEKSLHETQEKGSRRASRSLQSRSSSRNRVAFKEFLEDENQDSENEESENRRTSQFSAPRTPARRRSSAFAERMRDEKDSEEAESRRGSQASLPNTPSRRRSSILSGIVLAFKGREVYENEEEISRDEGTSNFQYYFEIQKIAVRFHL